MAKRRIADRIEDVWIDPEDEMPYLIAAIRKDPLHGGMLVKALDAYRLYHEFGELEILNHFDYVYGKY